MVISRSMRMVISGEASRSFSLCRYSVVASSAPVRAAPRSSCGRSTSGRPSGVPSGRIRFSGSVQAVSSHIMKLRSIMSARKRPLPSTASPSASAASAARLPSYLGLKRFGSPIMLNSMTSVAVMVGHSRPR